MPRYSYYFYMYIDNATSATNKNQIKDQTINNVARNDQATAA